MSVFILEAVIKHYLTVSSISIQKSSPFHDLKTDLKLIIYMEQSTFPLSIFSL